MNQNHPERPAAWAQQMREVHDRLRAALELSLATTDDGEVPEGADVLLYCWGFCAALTGHHAAEDDMLFPAVLDQRPELAVVVGRLVQDHSMIEHLLSGLRAAMDSGADPATVRGHLDGVGAIMESHFRYEERELLGPLEDLDLDASPQRALGPLA